MELLIERICENEESTNLLATEFAKFLKKGDFVALQGNLGTGKTFFVNSICNAWEIDFASSPTFSIVNQYGENPIIYHFDFYRIENEIELYDIGFEEYLGNKSAIVFVEWADLFPDVIPKKGFLIKFEFINFHTRKISIYKNG